jgi:hypothetical protein
MRVASLLVASLVLAGCAVGGTTKTVTVTRTVTTEASPGKGALGQTENARYFGTPVSITRLDAKRYALVLKPQFFLVGVTANVVFAAQQQNACAPLECPSPPDDRWVIPAGARNLLFVLPTTVKGTVLAMAPGGFEVTAVSGSELAAIIRGAKAPKLIEPLGSGLWLTIDRDTVTSFAQQFQP